jgi:hypothetical protein
MLGGAAGSEGAGNGEEDDLLVSPFCGVKVSAAVSCS